MKKIILFFIVLLSLLSISYAHLEAGEDKPVNGYLVDFGYAPEHPKTGEKVSFALNLVNETTGEPVDADRVWLRIAQEEVLFAGTLAAPDANAAFTYIFPKAGSYEITVRFQKDDRALAEADFSMDAKKKPARFSFFGFIFSLWPFLT